MKANKQAKKENKNILQRDWLILSTRAKVGERFRPFIPRCSCTRLCTQLGRGVFFYFVLQKKLLLFLCLAGNEEFAVTVREGVDTLQDIFEQINH